MKALSALSLILLCAAPVRVAIAQAGAKAGTSAPLRNRLRARRKSRSTLLAMASP